MRCNYSGDREAALAGWIYGELDAAERAAFEAHVETCAACRDERDALRGVREALPAWAPPVPSRLVARAAATPRRWAVLRDLPAWAQVAAAMLVLGASAGIARLDVRYERGALTLHTGWNRGADAGRGDAAAPASAAPWRADLAALEQSLRRDLAPAHDAGAQAASAAAQPGDGGAARPRAGAAAGADDVLLRRVRALIDESERRQQRELALRVAQVVRDLDAQRRADLVRIDRNLGLIQNNTGAEVLRQRELLNYLVRVSQRP